MKTKIRILVAALLFSGLIGCGDMSDFSVDNIGVVTSVRESEDSYTCIVKFYGRKKGSEVQGIHEYRKVLINCPKNTHVGDTIMLVNINLNDSLK